MPPRPDCAAVAGGAEEGGPAVAVTDDGYFLGIGGPDGKADTAIDDMSSKVAVQGRAVSRQVKGVACGC